MSGRIIAAALLIGALFTGQASAAIRTEEILRLSQKAQPESHQFAQEQNARFLPTGDGRSFVLWREPAGFNAAKDTVLVSLHGHGGWAARDFEVWYPHIKDRGYAFMAVQWWYGRSMEPIGYAKPRDIYAWITEALESRGIPRGHVIFEGFSMGSANSFAVTYLDRLQPEPYFAVTISQSGELESDFPPNRPFYEAGEKGRPFAGAHWILYCGERDTSRPNICEHMEENKRTLESFGATVDKFIRDPEGEHGGFMKSSQCGPALDLADTIVASGPSRK